MAKILKFIHAETAGVSPYGRDLMESFPEVEQPAPPRFDLVEAPEEEPEEEVHIDPEAIRQEIMAEARAEAEHAAARAELPPEGSGPVSSGTSP